MASCDKARVAIYARYSDERQNPSSAADQLAACEEFADRNGWLILSKLADEAISGTVKDRPGYTALRALISGSAVDIVLTESLDRLSRDQEETANLAKACRFHSVRIVTLSEGDITELHVGMSSTINAIYLKQLAEKTHRGLRARVLGGSSAGGRSYGYRNKLKNGVPQVGQLEIFEDEASIVRLVFESYANGSSPRAIAHLLNSNGTPSPSGRKWKANTLLGNRARGTGILNNELYVGRRVWNRLRYIKSPDGNRRVSRLNSPEEWVIDDVPHLRILDEPIWRRAKARQQQLDEVRHKSGGRSRLSTAHMAKSPVYLLSGLIRCGMCGGRMNIGGSNPKRYYCSDAREKGPSVCAGIPGIAQSNLERHVLDAIRDHLLEPQAVAQFLESYRMEQTTLSEINRSNAARLERALLTKNREIRNVLSAIKQGIITTSTKHELSTLEAQKDELTGRLAELSNSAPVIPGNIADLYRVKVLDLINTLNNETTKPRAVLALRSLLEMVVIHYNASEKHHELEIVGDLAALLSISRNKDAAAYKAAAHSLKMVAGAGFEPATFRL